MIDVFFWVEWLLGLELELLGGGGEALGLVFEGPFVG